MSVPQLYRSLNIGDPYIPAPSANVYVGTGTAMAVAADRVYLALLNRNSAVKIDVLRVYVAKEVTAAVTGLVRGYRLFRYSHNSAPTGGTSIAPVRLDTAMSALAGSIDCMVSSGSGVTPGGTPETVALGTAGVYEEETGGGTGQYDLFDWRWTSRPVVLNANEGVYVVQDSTAGTGVISASIVFRVR